MLTRSNVAVSVVLCALASVAAEAGPPAGGFHLSAVGGLAVFDPEVRFPGTGRLENASHLGGRLAYAFHPWFRVEAAGGYTATRQDTTGGEDVSFWHGSANLLLTPWSKGRLAPFAFAGGGMGNLESDSGWKMELGHAEYGGGLTLWPLERLGLRLEARGLNCLEESHSHGWLFTGGLTYALGGVAKDTDLDGVPDRQDRCADTDHDCLADAFGCPVDSDQDLVCDGRDRCHETPKGCPVDASGCSADADKDQVCDGLDRCPETPGGCLVDIAGCPVDADGDGVCDNRDQCRDTPQGATVDSVGCPADADQDGVLDGLDHCADTPFGARIDQDGCPFQQISVKETEMLETGMIRLRDVNFESGKAEILPESFAALDEVGEILGKWPQLEIEIGGHCDSRGSESTNQRLSEARVAAVRTYLLEQFPSLPAEQFTAVGYGESKPLVPNTNPINLAKNRRVEFVVLNREALRREVPPPQPDKE